MEHSLLAIAEWESITNKAYINPNDKNRSDTETFLYLQCMVLDDYELKPEDLTKESVNKIYEYLDKPHTATTIKSKEKTQAAIKTSEQIYAAMINCGVSKEYETWHIDRLLTLLAVIVEGSKEPEKMTQQEIYEQNIKLNEERRKKLQSKG